MTDINVCGLDNMDMTAFNMFNRYKSIDPEDEARVSFVPVNPTTVGGYFPMVQLTDCNIYAASGVTPQGDQIRGIRMPHRELKYVQIRPVRNASDGSYEVVLRTHIASEVVGPFSHIASEEIYKILDTLPRQQEAATVTRAAKMTPTEITNVFQKLIPVKQCVKEHLDQFYKHPSKPIYAALTNTRILKADKDKQFVIHLADVHRADFEDNSTLGMLSLHWNKVKLLLRNGKTDTVGLADDKAIQVFIEKINRRLAYEDYLTLERRT